MHLIKFRWVTAPLAADTYLIRLFLGGNLLQLAKIRKIFEITSNKLKTPRFDPKHENTTNTTMKLVIAAACL